MKGPPYNDPPPDSLFDKTDDVTNRCRVCRTYVWNNTESRDAHLNEVGCHIRVPVAQQGDVE